MDGEKPSDVENRTINATTDLESVMVYSFFLFCFCARVDMDHVSKKSDHNLLTALEHHTNERSGLLIFLQSDCTRGRSFEDGRKSRKWKAHKTASRRIPTLKATPIAYPAHRMNTNS